MDTHSLRSLSGKKLAYTLPRVFGRATYDHGFYGFSKLGCDDTCAEFLDQLLSVILSRPAYVHPSDVYRYASLIHEFKLAEFSDSSTTSPEPVAACRIRRLDVALGAWVRSFARHPADPLLLSFVLDAARLIQAHAWGESFSAERAMWTLEPMISGAGGRGPRLLPDRVLKHQISSTVSKLIVSVVIPRGCCVRRWDGKRVLKEGDLALFQPIRGHLSHDPYGPGYPFAPTEDDTPLKYDIGAELTFSGRIWRGKTMPKSRKVPGPRIVATGKVIGHTMVRGQWMTGYVDAQDWIFRKGVWKALPQWTP